MRKADRMNAFGITKSTFSEIRLFLKENTYYDFDDNYLDLAYQIKEKYDLSIEAAYNLITRFENIYNLHKKIILLKLDFLLCACKPHIRMRIVDEAYRIVFHMKNPVCLI